MFNFKVQTKLCEFGIVKLLSIVCDKDIRDPKSTHNIFPDKACKRCILYSGEWFHFHLFGEIICGYYNKLLLTFSSWLWSDEIYPPLRKGPKACY